MNAENNQWVESINPAYHLRNSYPTYRLLPKRRNNEIRLANLVPGERINPLYIRTLRRRPSRRLSTRVNPTFHRIENPTKKTSRRSTLRRKSTNPAALSWHMNPAFHASPSASPSLPAFLKPGGQFGPSMHVENPAYGKTKHRHRVSRKTRNHRRF
jgi:hypothetical protein